MSLSITFHEPEADYGPFPLASANGWRLVSEWIAPRAKDYPTLDALCREGTIDDTASLSRDISKLMEISPPDNPNVGDTLEELASVLGVGAEDETAVISSEDAYDDDFVDNAFCPTGEGGGVDPSCSPTSSEGASGASKGSDSGHESTEVNATKEALDLAHKLFGKHLTVADYGNIGLAPHGSTVTVHDAGGKLRITSEKVGEDGKVRTNATVTVYKPWFAPLTCKLDSLVVREGAAKGSGLELFDRQASSLAASGVKQITLNAAGAHDGGGNGYYTWPRYGFSGTLTPKQVESLPTDLKGKLGKGKDILDLMDAGGGNVWRDKVGTGIKAMTFDLTPGSRNMKALEAYKAERSKKVTKNAFCATGEGGGIDNSCGVGEGVGHEVEIHDPKTGEVFFTGHKDEAERMIREQTEMEPGHGLEIRSAQKSSTQAKADEDAARKKADVDREERTKEAQRQESLKTPHGLRPGHKDYVEPPPRLYHATFAADKIRSEGLKSGDEVGEHTLGGTASHLISFSTKENAETYRDGLNVARLAARGELSDRDMVDAGKKFGVGSEKMSKILANAPTDDPSRRSFNVLQQVAFEGKQFPLFMGSSWPKNLRSVPPATTVSVSTKDVKDIYYNPGEKEWRVGDYKGLKVSDG